MGDIQIITGDVIPSAEDIQIAEDRLNHDIAHLEDDRAHLLIQVQKLESYLEGAKEAGLSSATVERLNVFLAEAHDKLKILSQIIPEQSALKNPAVTEEVLRKWRAYDRERTHQTLANMVAPESAPTPSASEFDLDPTVWEDTHPLNEKIPDKKPAPVNAPAPKPIPPTPEPEKAPVPPPAPQKVETATMPQDIIPSDPQILAYADMQVRKHIDTIFGSKGFLGIGKKAGVDSPHWKDPFLGFADRKVTEITSAKINPAPTPGVEQIGIDSNEAIEKMQDYLLVAWQETGVHPGPTERTEDYLKRAASVAISKYVEKEGVLPQI